MLRSDCAWGCYGMQRERSFRCAFSSGLSPFDAASSAETAAALPTATESVAVPSANSRPRLHHQARILRLASRLFLDASTVLKVHPPGCAVAIEDHAAVVYAQGFGVADLTSAAPDTRTTISWTWVPYRRSSRPRRFCCSSRTASCRWTTTSICMWRACPPYGHALQLRDLLWMESGLSDSAAAQALTRRACVTDSPITIDEFLAAIESVKTLTFPPGPHSNTATRTTSCCVRWSSTSAARGSRRLRRVTSLDRWG